MDCPRCGVSVFADLSSCRACGWQLSQPFSPEPTAGVRAGSRAPEPLLQTAADAFVLSPPVGRAAQQRRLSRRARPPLNGRAVAVLPPEARWEIPPRFEVIELPPVQSAFDFSAAALEAERLAARAAAPLGLRFRAGLLDAALILLAAALFFALFALLGGPVGLARRDLLVYLLAAYALASAYFGLFTLLGGRTPGMQQYGLRVVTFEGQAPPAARALWRALGYGVSIGSLLLGFFWALVDERRLTWHDHISRTVLTHRTAP